MAYELELTNEDLSKEINAVYGERSFILEPGWYTLRINDVAEPIVKDSGIVVGTITFEDIDSCTSFKLPITYAVQDAKDKWRINLSTPIIKRLLQATKTQLHSSCKAYPSLKQAVGKQIYACVDVRTSQGRSGQIDEFGAPIMKEYKNNDFKKGNVSEVILPVPERVETQAEEFNADWYKA